MPKAAGVQAEIVPRHIAIIMDGNGRWARRQGSPRQAGHRAGVRAARDIVEAAGRRNIEYLTLFAFSSENWQRPSQEISLLMNLFLEALDDEIEELVRNNVRLRFVGDLETLNAPLREKIRAAELRTGTNDGLKLIVAVAYGGRWDLLRAARALALAVDRKELDPSSIGPADFEKYLALAGLPDPDLLIRTGGECRISNFLLWNLAYSELYFTDVLWPDFSSRELDEALKFFGSRDRRYGRVSAQPES